ncbi:hypothetical protein ANCDUO_17741 [Ancylostoma duodenale]|uniref:Uncharacterized protein n=1 Tax=Ancylostoma duodenale TaxID=51022 RepID=A0A0C2FZP4_9BILA|nr:hypothetical protein ANCDUO_17741 [Ancylostoma duodenale]
MNKNSLDGRVGGIILTGWQRYMHHAPLCELLAISIPSLVTDLAYLDDVERNGDELWKQVQVMEDLHMLEWKVSRFRFKNEMKDELMNEIKTLAEKPRFYNLHINVTVK